MELSTVTIVRPSSLKLLKDALRKLPIKVIRNDKVTCSGIALQAVLSQGPPAARTCSHFLEMRLGTMAVLKSSNPLFFIVWIASLAGLLNQL
jgi:hypothetical protein